ncbi:hypothetical protein J2S42_000749 [Catenuloplanes indicus]|uniref:Uncharacterized protein n=1 Tax=Catenuloplanes indicus TaxID=137267 RepID=A0AAE4AUR9_9ACTN|nr:hypothetical protein [Catenuloplanes indicus]
MRRLGPEPARRQGQAPLIAEVGAAGRDAAAYRAVSS